tara:strand:+ start:178 stop:585 length:408 start_codon:yes stop_codon:yes gene_type:complete
MAISLKPTLTLTSTSGASGVSEDSSLALSVADTLTVTDPMIGISRIACTTTGNETIILPDLDTTRYVYIKNTGLDASDVATTATVKVETANNTRIINLAADEFCFFPHKAENSGLIQLEASADTVIAEYGYWTKV